MNNWFGEFPSNWKFERLQNYLFEINEKNNPIKTSDILSLTNKLGVVPYSEKGNQGNVAKENISEYKIAYPNTIVCNCMNVLIGSVGISKYYGCVSPVYYVFKAKDNANLEFLNYIFQTTEFQKELRRYANGILEIRLRVSSDNILKRRVPIPSLEEQNKIVKEIKSKEEKINALITNEEKQIEKLKEYKQTLISEVVTKGLNPNVPMKESGTKLANKIPANWRISRLKYEVTCNDDSLGENCSPNAALKYVDIGSVDFYDGITEVKNVLFEDAPSRARRITKKGDVIVSTVRTYLKAVATINENGLIVSTGFAVLRSRGQIADQFLSYYCRSNLFTSYVYLHSNGINYPAINASALICAPVFLPPSEEQLYISDFLNTKCSFIDKLINKGFAKIAVLRKYRQSLIYEYVTGKREVS